MRATALLWLLAAAAPAQATERYKATLGHAAVRGPADAKVTIVVWADYQCPFCAAELPVLDKLFEHYGRDLRLAWRQWPSFRKPDDVMASEAALAAREQGKFWPMHALLYAHQERTNREGFQRYAQQLGLDLKRFAADLDRHTYLKELEEDSKEGIRLGAGSTPTMFVNGRLLRGFHDYDQMAAMIDEEIQYADTLVRKGTPRAKLYDRILADAHAYGPPENEDGEIYDVDITNAPARGPASAKVTIVEFGDYQCPFCARTEQVLTELRRIYGNKIRVVWKDFPMPMHPQAHLAAEAARVAGEQGKYWQMHDRLLAHQDALGLTTIEEQAQAIGLDMARFRKSLDSGVYRDPIDRDFEAAQRKLDVNGTPTFFINGHRLAGAAPIDRFRELIERALGH